MTVSQHWYEAYELQPLVKSVLGLHVFDTWHAWISWFVGSALAQIEFFSWNNWTWFLSIWIVALLPEHQRWQIQIVQRQRRVRARRWCSGWCRWSSQGRRSPCTRGHRTSWWITTRLKAWDIEILMMDTWNLLMMMIVTWGKRQREFHRYQEQWQKWSV